MKNKRLLLVLFALLLGNMYLFAQVKRTVTGVVRDNTGKPLPSATITIKGTTQSVVTDEDGRYSLTIDKNNAVIVISSVGFTSKEMAVGSASTLDATITSSVTDMNEVIVTALGVKREKKSIGYAIQQVKAEDITKAAPVDLAQGLVGKVAGLNISTSNGLNNSSSRIVVRGNNSLLGNNQPLIVIDGAIIDNKSLPQSTTGTQDSYQDWGNYLSYVNMDNVEDVTVLKGPNAAALYGARGANGVIQITTKKGIAKKGLGVDYNYTNMVTNAFRYMDVQNEYGGGFADALWTANPKLPKTSSGEYYVPTLYPGSWQANGGNAYAVGGSGYESSHNTVPGGRNTWDQFSWFGAGSSWGPRLDGTMARWWDGELRPYNPQPDNREYMFRQGTEQTHNLSFSNASEFGSIRLSGTYTKATSPIENTNYNNKNFSLGSRLKISKALSAELSAAYNQNYRLNAPQVGNNNSWSKFMIYGMSREYKPLEKDMYKNADGSKNQFPGAYPHNEYSRDMFWSIYENNQRLWRDEFLSTIKVNAEITPWLNGFVRTSVDLIGSRFESQNTTTERDKVSGGRFDKTISKDKLFNTDIMLTAHKDNLFVNGFNASLSGMFNQYSNNSTGVSGSNWSRFIVPDVYSLSNYVNRDQTSFSESRYDVKSQSLLGILNLSYKDYLFLDVTGRNDINSTLPKDNNSYFYPSANLSFVFSEALDIRKRQNVLSYGKVRLSYGKSANATDPYQNDAAYSVGSFGGQPTNSVPTTIPAPNLQFQTNTSYEVGFNLGFLNDRINLDFTYYNMLGENQILKAPVPASSGSSEIIFNTAKLRNKGVELIINASPIRTTNFSWNTALNFARNRNEVEDITAGVPFIEIGNVFGSLGVVMKVHEGEQYGTLYGTDFKRDASGNKIVRNIKDLSTGAVVGTEYEITSEQVPIGNAAPKFTGGWSNTLRYKRFALYALIDFKVGGDIYSFDHATGAGSGLIPETLVERNGGGLPYTYPDGTTANHGVILEGFNADDNKPNDRVVHYLYKWGNMYAGWSHFNRPRSLSVFENTWVKLREVALTYDLPKSLTAKSKIFQGLSVSLIGRNLGYIHSSLPDHLNPEAVNGTGNAQGLQWSAFPSFRSFGVSVRANF